MCGGRLDPPIGFTHILKIDFEIYPDVLFWKYMSVPQGSLRQTNIVFFFNLKRKYLPQSLWKGRFYRVSFCNWCPPKNSKCQPVSKFWHFLDGIYYVIWHLELLGGHQFKKTPCTLKTNFKKKSTLLVLVYIEKIQKIVYNSQQSLSTYGGGT